MVRADSLRDSPVEAAAAGMKISGNLAARKLNTVTVVQWVILLPSSCHTRPYHRTIQLPLCVLCFRAAVRVVIDPSHRC